MQTSMTTWKEREKKLNSERGHKAIGKNVQVAVIPDNTLNIVVDLDKEFGVSTSGKSVIVATTGGGKRFSDEFPDYRINVTIYKV